MQDHMSSVRRDMETIRNYEKGILFVRFMSKVDNWETI